MINSVFGFALKSLQLRVQGYQTGFWWKNKCLATFMFEKVYHDFGGKLRLG